MKRTTRSRLSAVAAVGPLLLAVVLAGCGGGSGSSGSGAGGTSLTQFCNDGRSILATIPSVLSGDSSLAPPGKAELTSYAVQLRKLAGEAPAQIKGDLTTTAAFFEQASLNGIGAVDSTTTSNARAAADRLHTFGSQNCGSGSSTPTASTGTASGWSSSPIERTDVRMKGVSCASATFCVAFDEIYQAFIYNGTSWSKTGGQMALVSVSCPSATFCVALSGIGNAFIYNGTSWLPSLIGQPKYGFHLVSVSCPNANFCVAVDDQGQAFTYNGSSWSSPVSSIVGTPGYGFVSVSCSSATFCAGLDNKNPGSAYIYNGSAWSSASHLDTSRGGLGAVSCPSASFCVALNSIGDAYTYNGSSWSSPSFIATGHSTTFLKAVSCPSASFCVAVEPNYALTYNGSAWSVINTAGGDAVSCPSASFCVVVDQSGSASIYNGR
jgi:hypothetical protein